MSMPSCIMHYMLHRVHSPTYLNSMHASAASGRQSMHDGSHACGQRMMYMHRQWRASCRYSHHIACHHPASCRTGTDGAHAADSPLESPATNPILHAGSTPFHAAATAHGRPHATQLATRMGPSDAGTYQTPAAAPHQQAGVYTGPSSSVQLHTGGTSAGNTSYATPGSLLQTPLSAQPVGSPRVLPQSPPAA